MPILAVVLDKTKQEIDSKTNNSLVLMVVLCRGSKQETDLGKTIG